MVLIGIVEMTSGANRYIAAFLLAVGLIIVVIILIIHGLLSGPSVAPSVPKSLTDYVGTSTSVQFTIDSPVASADQHKDVIINVSNYQATLTVTQGYEGQVLRSQSYPMSSNSFATFLSALNYNGFTQGNSDPALKDERGHCALGARYVYEILDSNGDDIQHYWYTSCGSGTFSGNAAAIQQLFINQITNYNKLTNDVRL
jgi:hypothetical protein